MIFKNLQYNVINRLSAHLKNAKKLKAYHDWFLNNSFVPEVPII